MSLLAKLRAALAPSAAPLPPIPDSRFRWMDELVRQTRVAVFVRRADALLLIRPDKTMGLNATATEILDALYARDAGGAREVLSALAPRLGVDLARLVDDTDVLLQSLSAVLRQDFSPRPGLRFQHFDRGSVKYPTIAEIALTYRCNNACTFCYAASPYRAADTPVMTTAEVERVMERIYREAHVPSLSFTGGEATLRADLPHLIAYGKRLGFRVNVISNGVKSGDLAFARSLAEAGLDSTQLSIEGHTATLHDRIVAKPGAFARTVAAVRNYRELGVHVHTNSTLCADNFDDAEELVRFAARELGLRTMSMNMLIRTGSALGRPGMELSYTQVAAKIPALVEVAEQEGILLVWYSPIPYCIFNPVLAGLGAKSCACVDGILSVDPSGQVLPCSSFERGLGSLLERSWTDIYASDEARYWREKRYVPPSCRGCPHTDICGGACPLYWDACGSFRELPLPDATDAEARAGWERARHEGGSFGIRDHETLVKLRRKPRREPTERPSVEEG